MDKVDIIHNHHKVNELSGRVIVLLPYENACTFQQLASLTNRSTKLSAFCLVGFLTSSSTTRLYRGRAQRQSVCQFYVLPRMRQSWETMTSVSASHIILTPTQPVGSGRPKLSAPDVDLFFATNTRIAKMRILQGFFLAAALLEV